MAANVVKNAKLGIKIEFFANAKLKRWVLEAVDAQKSPSAYYDRLES
jgi:hypothetical protein